VARILPSRLTAELLVDGLRGFFIFSIRDNPCNLADAFSFATDLHGFTRIFYFLFFLRALAFVQSKIGTIPETAPI
jgi:hypothetical protein